MGLLRQRYAVVTAQSWELARAGYLSGLSARVVCERFGMGEHNLRKRAREQGWTKRAYAVALAPSGGPAPPPLAAAEPVAAPAGEGSDLLDTVLRRAREALTAGRGGEASALIKAAREYVIVHQDVVDARDAIARTVTIWDTAQPARAGAVTETLLVQTLHGRWTGLSVEETAERVDPDGKLGFGAWVNETMPPVERPAGRKGRR